MHSISTIYYSKYTPSFAFHNTIVIPTIPKPAKTTYIEGISRVNYDRFNITFHYLAKSNMIIIMDIDNNGFIKDWKVDLDEFQPQLED